ncbi:MAG: F0F1 ATP synthase subunit epsilon [Chloroflexi bacterium]|uniref:ATP synthase epsilon chain n=1 Tax=Candidatus Chlorohelix allophototropha TaxID=3003348 RepID=A0A8T7M884_9CHLR|nr:F0F1 ATP synthase subunit epsilon [Chloroflexota bacterium]WJW68172.1 F0F1 ATP synthase subunit epsilon [Chloroflexota bacterium L227-S17]
MPLRLQIVTAERVVFDEDVDYVTAPGEEGVLGILPRHAPLLSGLQAGELRYRRGADQTALAIGGGFIEIFNNKVIVLADSAERSDEIDLSRAEVARKRAENLLQDRTNLSQEDALRAEVSLRRALVRIEVSRRHSGRGGVPRMTMDE